MGSVVGAERLDLVEIDLGPRDRRRLVAVVLGLVVALVVVPALLTAYVFGLVVFGSAAVATGVAAAVLVPVVIPMLLHSALMRRFPSNDALAVLLPLALGAALVILVAGIAIDLSGLAALD